jgi:hypothetical protein
MDPLVVIFAASLVVAGIVLIAVVRSGFSREVEPERGRSTHQQAVKAQRQMERRRGRVWWKMEDLYAEFVERDAVRGSSGLPPPAEVTPPADECVAGVKAGEGFTLKDVQGAYEVFLRKS